MFSQYTEPNYVAITHVAKFWNCIQQQNCIAKTIAFKFETLSSSQFHNDYNL